MFKPDGQKGFTLIELLIALGLGLILTLGVTQIYLGSSTTYRLTDAMAKMQENVRFADGMMARTIREAGNTGCLIPGLGAGVQDLRKPPSSGPSLPAGAAIVGWEYQGTGSGDSFTLSNALASGSGSWSNNPGTGFPDRVTDRTNFVQGSDAFIVRGATPNALDGNQVGAGGGNQVPIVDAGGGSASSGIPAGSVIQLVGPDCDSAFRFVKGNNESATTISVDGNDNQAGASINSAQINTVGARVLTFESTLYFIGQDLNGEPALFRQSLANIESTPPPQQLMSGVENMQLLYGIGDENGVDEYVTADDANLTNWNQVVAIRLALLMRSDANIRGEEEERKFNLLGAEATTPKDERARVNLIKTFALRNQLN